MEKVILRYLLLLGIGLVPFAFQRKNLKEWLLVFFLKGYISSFLANVVVKNKNISYPIRFLPKYFHISILFDYLLFPLLGVFFNRTTYRTKWPSTILQSMLYSAPMTILEVIFERKTGLIRYKKNWSWVVTYGTLVWTFLFVRGAMGLFRKFSK
ncbi:hypothetical protein LCL95_00305 [Bacillus timonensis]|nr:hypothetical protein [Bacillus timonensis]